jgi:hypothetical protein
LCWVDGLDELLNLWRSAMPFNGTFFVLPLHTQC